MTTDSPARGPWTEAALAGLARRFSERLPHMESGVGDVTVTLLRLLAEGEPVPVARLASRTQRTETELRALLDDWAGVYQTEQGVTGFGGLSIDAQSGYRLRVNGRTLYARCAWDTLFLPGLLGLTAEVDASCAVTGAPIRLQVTPDTVTTCVPPGVHLSMLEPHTGMARNLTDDF